jgi:hypothetical protein
MKAASYPLNQESAAKADCSILLDMKQRVPLNF